MKKNGRLTVVLVLLYGAFLLVLGRLFYWQVIKSQSLQAIAQNQYQQTIKVEGSRGSLYTQDGYLLVGNEKVYRLFAEPPLLETDHQEFVKQMLPVLTENLTEFKETTEEAKLDELEDTLKNNLIAKLDERSDTKWVGLINQINEVTKEKLEQLKLPGLGFEEYEIRFYPEASTAAHLTGFVGKNQDGEDTGYFGLEGALEKELQKRIIKKRFDTGIFGLNFLTQSSDQTAISGRDIVLSIRRDVQNTLEQELEEMMLRYGAKAAEVVVMEPTTGQVIGSASFPRYDQKKFYEYDQSLYKNPIVAHTFEPGSIFKVITVAAGLESGAITPDTICEECAGPKEIGKYTIKTWNNEYHPDITMTEALAKSDNVAMVYAQEKIGEEDFVKTITDFGIGKSVTEDLQEDVDTPFPQKWGPVELATVSFGQGITTNTLQMVRAVGAIANKGTMMKPSFVSSVKDPSTNQEITVKPQVIRQVVSPDTARKVTEMMVTAASHGEAQWIASKTRTPVAGKTGTAQIAVGGTYDPDKTIASFIGFAPADNPRFVMMVKFIEPESSPWAAETAAPAWYKIAEKLYLLLDVPSEL